MTTWTGPLQTKLTNQSINWEQRMAPFFVNRPMKPKNGNNGLTTKIWNPTKLRRVAYVSQTLSLFDWFVSILFFQTFFDFSTFQTVSENYKILTIFFHNGLSPLHSIVIELSGGIYDCGRRLSQLLRERVVNLHHDGMSPQLIANEVKSSRHFVRNVFSWGTMIKTTTLSQNERNATSGEMWCNTKKKKNSANPALQVQSCSKNFC